MKQQKEQEMMKAEAQVESGSQQGWVTVYVDPGSGKNKGTIFVGVNGKGYYVPRGKSVEVPPEVAEVLRNREAMLEHAEQYSESVSQGN